MTLVVGGCQDGSNARIDGLSLILVTGKVYKKAVSGIWINSDAAIEGTWKWQGSNDDASWTDIGSYI